MFSCYSALIATLFSHLETVLFYSLSQHTTRKKTLELLFVTRPETPFRSIPRSHLNEALGLNGLNSSPASGAFLMAHPGLMYRWI